MMKRIAAILIIGLVVGFAPPASAASWQDQPTPPPDSPLAIGIVPDLVGYITIAIPNPLASAFCESEPTGGSWFDVAYQLTHLAWLIRQLFNQLICALVGLLQALANGLAGAINAMAVGMNSAWRFAIFAWLTIRSWLLAGWYLFEVVRAALGQIETWLASIQLYAALALTLAAQVLLVLGQLAGEIVQTAVSLGGMLGWIGGLLIGSISTILTAVQATTTPEQLTSTHPIYQIVRGMGEGIRDSSIGWLLVVVWGMCYVAFVLWFGRFLSTGGD